MRSWDSKAGLAADQGRNQAASHSYMICAVPRTGSYLLCDLLKRTGVAGCPNEYFNESFQVQWTKEWGTTALGDYVNNVLRLGTTPNGVFGVKVHPMQFDSLCRQLAGKSRVPYAMRPDLLKHAFPDLRYVRLTRRDNLKQAISYVRAIQTRAWWDTDKPPGPSGPVKLERLRFDFHFIERALHFLAAMDQRWLNYFDTLGLSPLMLEYEDLIADPLNSVNAVLEWLGVGMRPGDSCELSPFRRQADEQTEEWVDRFQRIRDGAQSPLPGIGMSKFSSPKPTSLLEWSWSGPRSLLATVSDSTASPLRS
jgi:trehalose 2-sulfotransferase